MLSHDIDAVVRGRHADPFGVLGPHEEADGLAIRSFWPGARAMAVVTPAGQPVLPLTRLHREGVFEGILAGQPRDGFDYRLRVEEETGRTFDLDDPYRYGPVLSDFDLHLLGEGTHVRAWERLGARPITHGIRDGVHFAVWAPSARRVSVVGDFNRWDGRVHPMRALAATGRSSCRTSASAIATSSRSWAPTEAPC
jgi:1,4-alpha-glucan branching enzyme